MNAKEHNRLVGIFLLAHGGLQAVLMILLGLIYGGIGAALLVGGRQGDEKIGGLIFIGLTLFLLVFSAIFVIPQILGGYKLLKEKANARTWGIIGNIIACLSFPIGTAAGIYGLWFLFGDLGKRFYLGGNNQNMFHNPPQPPAPGAWQ